MDTTSSSAPATTPPSGGSVTPGEATPPITPSSTTPSEIPPTSAPPPKKGVSTLLFIILLAISFIGGLILATWYFQSQLNQSDQSKTQANLTNQTKTLIVGTDATAPPMEYMNKEGAIIGYDIDLGYLIANELGYKVTFKNIPWSQIFQDLKDKKIDMIISSATITEERKKEFIFSDAYINAGQVIVSRKDKPIRTVDELDGKKIAVQKNTTNEKEALKLTKKNLVLSFDEFINAAKSVSTGQADALISDLTLAKGFIDQYENLKITSDPFTNEYYGIIIHQDNTELREQVNKVLATLKIKGVLTNLKQRWLE